MSGIIILILLFVIAVAVVRLIRKNFGTRNDQLVSVYEKKPYLFDTNSEFNLYKVLLELFGDQYFIFPQVNYGHLIRPKKISWAKERNLRSRIDRKSADFVLCDREQIVPRLVIELDGSAHDLKKKKERDEFINEITESIGLPLLRLKVGDVDKESIRGKISKKL